MTETLKSFDSPSGQLHFRAPTLEDVPNLTARAYDPECVKYLPHLVALTATNSITNESNSRNVEGWRKNYMKTELFVMVVRKSDGLAIGDGGFESLDLERREGDAGIILNSDVRGKGYAIDALKAFFNFGFTELGLERIYVKTLKANEPMKGLMERKFGLIAVETEGDNGTECFFKLERDDWNARLRS